MSLAILSLSSPSDILLPLAGSPGHLRSVMPFATSTLTIRRWTHPHGPVHLTYLPQAFQTPKTSFRNTPARIGRWSSDRSVPRAFVSATVERLEPRQLPVSYASSTKVYSHPNYTALSPRFRYCWSRHTSRKISTVRQFHCGIDVPTGMNNTASHPTPRQAQAFGQGMSHPRYRALSYSKLHL